MYQHRCYDEAEVCSYRICASIAITYIERPTTVGEAIATARETMRDYYCGEHAVGTMLCAWCEGSHLPSISCDILPEQHLDALVWNRLHV